MMKLLDRPPTRLPAVVMAAITVAWVDWMAWLSLARWESYGYQAFDHGIFTQGLWLLAQGHDPFVTLRGLNLFADHSSYAMILLVPLMWLWEDTRLLVLVTVLAVAAAGPFAYVVARRVGARPWTAVVAGTVVLLHPAMAWHPWGSFHPEILVIPLFPAAFLAVLRGRWWLVVVLSGLMLSTREDAVLLVGAFAAYLWWSWPRARRTAVVVGVLTVVVGAVNVLVVLPWLSPSGELLYAGRYTTNVVELVSWSRVGYVLAMLLPVFPVFAARRVLAIGVPAVVANLVSTSSYQHEVQRHYTAYLLAVLAVAVPVGMAAWRGRVGVFVGDRRYVARPRLAIVSVAAGLVWFGPGLTPDDGWRYLGRAEAAELTAALEQIPDGAVVSAGTGVAARLALRDNIYMFPNPFERRYWGAAGSEMADWQTVEWLVYNEDSLTDERRVMLDQRIPDGGWELEWQIDHWRAYRVESA